MSMNTCRIVWYIHIGIVWHIYNRVVHELYPYERWRGHSTIFLHVSTRRDDLGGSHDKLFLGFANIWIDIWIDIRIGICNDICKDTQAWCSVSRLPPAGQNPQKGVPGTIYIFVCEQYIYIYTYTQTCIYEHMHTNMQHHTMKAFSQNEYNNK